VPPTVEPCVPLPSHTLTLLTDDTAEAEPSAGGTLAHRTVLDPDLEDGEFDERTFLTQDGGTDFFALSGLHSLGP
jgi:hypothetical protein